MAAEKPTTHSAEIVAAPFGMPRVEIPLAATFDDFGRAVFVLDTSAGIVHVTSWAQRRLDCRGEAPALIAAGLACAEWFPGLPGNQKSRQQVIFEPAGPRLRIREDGGKKQTQPHITIWRISSRTFVVEVPATPEQCKRLEAFHERWESRNESRREKEDLSNHEKRLNEYLLNRKSEELRRSARSALELFAFAISIGAKGPGVRYADDVMAEVNTHLDAIGRAFLGGKILPAAPQYQRDGNVVFFPGATATGNTSAGTR